MKAFCFLLFFTFTVSVSGQDTVYARKIIDTLSSPAFNGRGYTNDGLFKAFKFLSKEFTDIGLKPMNGNSYLQSISFSINTFPGEMYVSINGDSLRPGYEFIVGSDSRGLSGSFKLERIDSANFINRENNLVIALVEKLTASVSRKVGDSTKVYILKSAISNEPGEVKLAIENRFDPDFKTGNICGLVKGTNKKKRDTLVVFTAHYDHLGGMGKNVFFPGANDNASGISLLLGLARWYAKNPQEYSIGFILFSGEEAGLVGSEYFVKKPLVPLKSIKFLVNLDLTGTGVEGITVVNATKYVKQFELLKSINENNKYLVNIHSRGKAKNSDHYWFSEKGVPSFFIYTMGGIKAYHDVHDISATLPNNEYSDLFLLLTKFVDSLNRK
jgi:hypothetical protein